MKMCEYANNLIDMFLLVSITNKNKKIVYDRNKYYLLYIFVAEENIYMVFPRMYKGINYIELDNENKTISFKKANEMYLRLKIYYY